MELPIIKSPVTYLEMAYSSDVDDIKLDGYEFILEKNPDVDTYINIYRDIGRDYIWNYRPGQEKDEIEKLIQSPNAKLFYLRKEKRIIGMAECDFTNPEDVEIVHFGLLPDEIDKGLGRKFFQKLLHTLGDYNPKRIHLSTCGMDHPKAVDFYQSAGFKVYKTKEGTFQDYRYSGFYNMDDAPQIPHGVIND